MRSTPAFLALAMLLAAPVLHPVWGSATHSAIAPVPRNEPWWQDRHKSMNQRAVELGDKAQVVFIGDSITQGWEGEGKGVWGRYYAHRNAINLGIGGDRTQHVLWRLENGNLDGIKPKAAVVMIGTNNSGGEDNTPGQIVEGVAAIVRSLRARLPQTRILLLAIFPRSENFSAQRGKLLQINQVLHRLADEQTVYWVDFGHQFVNDEGLIPQDLMPDFLHLSSRGYEVWAEAIEARLAAILGDTPIQAARVGNAGAGASLTGEWIWTIKGPDGNPVNAPLILKQEGGTITGRFSRGGDRWLDIQDGKASDGQFSWSVRRDRPNGGTMTYRMSGKLEGDRITGTATTEMDGQETKSDWSAQRNPAPR